jgi:hypothetical protein
MTQVKFGSKPKGWVLMPAGERVLRIESVKGMPRSVVTLVEIEFKDAEGTLLKNKYDLTNDGGYAAFYYLVSNGLGINLDEDDSFDIDQMQGHYVLVEIVHKDGTKPREDGTVPVFANIKSTLGPGEPFGDEAPAAAPKGEDEESWD